MVFGKPRSFHKKFKFVVQVDGFQGGDAKAYFQKASEVSAEVAKVEYSEGGTLIPDKSPGRVTVTDVTLERGVTVNQDLYDWFVDVVDIAANSGIIDPQYKRMVDLVQQDRDGTTLRRWRLHNAWPVKFTAGEWDNEADENVIEMVTLTYDYPELINLEPS
jgi:phage tail-like protein